MDVHHLKHTLNLCLESRYLSDRARGNVMQLTSRMRFSASSYPPSAASAPTHASSPALSHLSALQGSMRASHTMCSPARHAAFQSAGSRHKSEARPGKRRSSSSNKPVATSAQFGRGMRAPQSAATANVILPVETIAVLEGFGLEKEDVLEAQLQVRTSQQCLDEIIPSTTVRADIVAILRSLSFQHTQLRAIYR